MVDDQDLPWRQVDGGVALKVRVTPKGGRDVVDGVVLLGDGQAVLKLRVRAVPEDGAANRAVIELLAKALHVPRSRLTLEQGVASRVKTVHLSGTMAELGPLLAQLAP